MKRGRILPFLIAVVGCSESAVTPAVTQLTLEIVGSQETRIPIDRATVRLEGPTSRTLDTAPRDTFTIGDLRPGTYDVAVEGWTGNSVAWFSELSVRLDEGQQERKTVSIRGGFAPETASATVDGEVVSIQWAQVQGATEYLVEASGLPGSSGFTEQGRTAGTSFQVGPLDPGAYVVRVQAINRFGNGGSTVEQAVVVGGETFALSVSREGAGSGTVTSSPGGIDCGSDCSEAYDSGTQVTLTAVAGEDSDFVGWSGGGCSGTGTCVVTMSQARTVTAAFSRAPSSYSVTVVVEEGVEYPVGSVVSEPAGLVCRDGGQCSFEFPADAEVALNHVWPDEWADDPQFGGSTFGGWSGDCEGFGACTLLLDGPKQVTATATEDLAVVDLEPTISSGSPAAPAGATMILSWNANRADCEQYIEPNGANASTDCQAWLAPGTPLRITSSVAPMEWAAGACDYMDETTCETIVGSGEYQSLGATWLFEPPPGHSLLEVLYIGRTDGTIFSSVSGIYNDVGIFCGLGDDSYYGLYCTAVYPDGTEVTLTAEAASGYTFVGWEGAGCYGTDPCTVAMNEYRAVVPVFEPVSSSPDAAGRVR